MDAGGPLPLPDRAFDRVFAEHLIEHLPRRRGRALLEEIHRVLRPGGRLRVDTPDLAFLATAGSTTEGSEFLRRARERHFPGLDGPVWATALDHWARAWGHAFLYDEETLAHDLESAGFTSVRRHAEGESEDPHFIGAERHGSAADSRLNHLSTLALEAERPA